VIRKSRKLLEEELRVKKEMSKKTITTLSYLSTIIGIGGFVSFGRGSSFRCWV